MILCRVTITYPGAFGTDTFGGEWGLWDSRPDRKTFTRGSDLELITAYKDGDEWRVGSDAVLRWREIGVIR